MQEFPDEIKLTLLLAAGIVLILLFAVVMFFIFYRKKQTELFIKQKLSEVENKNIILEKDLERIKAVQTERLRISMDMHDEMGSSLSNINMLISMFQKKNKHVNSSDLEEISEIAHELSNSMKEMVWSLNPEQDCLEHFLTRLKQWHYSFFEKSTIETVFTLMNEQPASVMSGHIRHNLFLALKEIYNNAYKYSQASLITTNISLVMNKLQISISDNGIGIDSSKLKQGNGLKNIRKRIEFMKGTCEIFMQSPGVMYNIEIPLG